jgi:hypothetical protein
VTKKKRKKKGQAQIDNLDTLATPGTKDTRRRKRENKTQLRTLKRRATPATKDT